MVKTPTNWIRYDDFLRQFSVRDLGGSIAALKIYMVISLNANYKPTPDLKIAGSAQLSYTDFENLLQISRATVAKGIAKLKKIGLIDVDYSTRPAIYSLPHYLDDSQGWGKLPKRYLFGTERHGTVEKIAAFSMRHRAHLNALRIYLLLISFSRGTPLSANLSYDKITEYTGMSREHIHPALSVLFDMQLVSVKRDEAWEGKNQPNLYSIHGFVYAKRKTL